MPDIDSQHTKTETSRPVLTNPQAAGLGYVEPLKSEAWAQRSRSPCTIRMMIRGRSMAWFEQISAERIKFSRYMMDPLRTYIRKFYHFLISSVIYIFLAGLVLPHLINPTFTPMSINLEQSLKLVQPAAIRKAPRLHHLLSRDVVVTGSLPIEGASISSIILQFLLLSAPTKSPFFCTEPPPQPSAVASTPFPSIHSFREIVKTPFRWMSLEASIRTSNAVTGKAM